MLFSILLIYLIILTIFLYEKKKKNAELTLYNHGQLLIQTFWVLFFLFTFLVGLRVLNIFREIKILDLSKITVNFNLFLIIILIYFVRKLIIYIFKISWFKIHYVMMADENFSELINDKYKYFFYKFIYFPAFYSYKYFFYLNIFFTLGIFFFFFYDLIFNNLILNYTLIYLRYYSLFKVIYISYKFMATKQNLILDYYGYSLMYPGIIENSFFMNFDDQSHQNLKEESSKYISGVILEKNKYVSRYLGNTAEMPYFKRLRR